MGLIEKITGLIIREDDLVFLLIYALISPILGIFMGIIIYRCKMDVFMAVQNILIKMKMKELM